jgi:hypothetical protein
MLCDFSSSQRAWPSVGLRYAGISTEDVKRVRWGIHTDPHIPRIPIADVAEKLSSHTKSNGAARRDEFQIDCVL